MDELYVYKEALEKEDVQELMIDGEISLANQTYEHQFDTIPEGLYGKDTRKEIENLQEEFEEIFSFLVEKPDSELTLEEALAKLEEVRREADDAKKKAQQAKQEAAEIARKEARQMLARAEAAMEESKRLAALAQEKAAQAEAAQKVAQQAKEELEKLKAQLGQKENGQKVSVKKVSLKAAKSQKKRELKVTWKKVGGVSGYQVQYSTNAKFKNAKTKKLKASKTSLKLKNLKSKKTYYVRVRAYQKTDSGTVYGTYSKAKKGKVK